MKYNKLRLERPQILRLYHLNKLCVALFVKFEMEINEK
jgi:hypothetical protein